MKTKAYEKFLEFALSIIHRWNCISGMDVNTMLECVDDDDLAEFGQRVAEMFYKLFILGIEDGDTEALYWFKKRGEEDD